MALPQRHCFILQGDRDWLTQQADSIYQQAGTAAGRCWLSESPDSPPDAVTSKQALQQLGRSNALIVFDARERFSADAFGALIGTLNAGGLMLVLLPERQSESLWLRRFLKTADRYSEVTIIKPGRQLPEIVLPEATQPHSVIPTTEQCQAIDAVLHVVSGHRRRPLVITSDRGRGKTALLGMAAAELLKQGKKRILVTAPLISNIETLLDHAEHNLTDVERTAYGLQWQQDEIRFVAPDALLRSKPPADLLIVDEASAIPSAMLESMLEAYSRIVFSCTEHGYEGTGRGFALRFNQTLDRLTPDWRSFAITQPVRWAVNDGLEAFSFEALLLDAEPVSEASLPADSVKNAAFAVIDKKQLADNETLLREIYGLMVLAHYRTRPSDLQMLLDRDEVTVAVLQTDGHVIASAWLVSEPALPASLAQQVFDGRRRLKGQLLPQTLLAHSGVLEAGKNDFQRILRIAVHPSLQGQGLGSRLLEQIHQHVSGRCDVIGTSFAMDARLLNFWQANAFLPVRVGQQADEVSGQRAGILLRAVSAAGESLVTKAQRVLRRDWPFLLLQTQNTLDHALAIRLSETLPVVQLNLDSEEMHALQRFAFEQRPYESSEPLLWQWLHTKLAMGRLAKLEPLHQMLLVKKILQGQAFADVAKSCKLAGRKAVIEQLRQAVAVLLTSE